MLAHGGLLDVFGARRLDTVLEGRLELIGYEALGLQGLPVRNQSSTPNCANHRARSTTRSRLGRKVSVTTVEHSRPARTITPTPR